MSQEQFNDLRRQEARLRSARDAMNDVLLRLQSQMAQNGRDLRLVEVQMGAAIRQNPGLHT